MQGGMVKSNPTWQGQRAVLGQPDDMSSSQEMAQFGYEKIAAAEKAGKVLRHFDGVAEKYDVMNSLLSLGIHHIWKNKAVQSLNLQTGARVLDVCGGTGDLSLLAAGVAGPTGRVVLYDINEKMMLAGSTKVFRSPAGGTISYVQGDAEQLAFPDGAFDGTMVGFGIRNLVRMKLGFQEMYRVLKPGGKMLCLEFSKPTFSPFRWLYDLYSFHIMPYIGEMIVGNRDAYTHLPESIRTFPLPEELNTLLEGIGFRDVAYQKLTNGIAVIHTAAK